MDKFIAIQPYDTIVFLNPAQIISIEFISMESGIYAEIETSNCYYKIFGDEDVQDLIDQMAGMTYPHNLEKIEHLKRQSENK
jgi:hypothetical protein